jgi:saccharopine dehydrogenase-like NADP-dependent oxidoreductase
MKVLALGGSGDMGRHAVRTALDLEFVEEVVIADLNADAASRFASSCGPRTRAVGLDVQDEAALGAQLREADVVLNTVGPFYRFGVPILRAAIAARCPYIDICDDWEPTLEMLDLDAEARAAGIPAIVGLGASPGISNLLAVKAISALDEVEEVVTGWGVGGGPGGAEVETAEAEREPSAAVVHWLHQCSGTIRLCRDGALVDVVPVQEVELDYPGVGRGAAWTVGHPEAVTLPRVFPQIRQSSNVMVAPRWLIDVLLEIRTEIDAGRLTAEDGARLLLGPWPPEERPGGSAASEAGVRLPPLFAWARGTLDGREARAGALVLGAPSGGMGGVTGVPMGLGLTILRDPTGLAPGIFPPEAVIEPDPFFDALAPRCSPPVSGHEKLVLVTTSD